jgi:hypothetical protein
VTQSGGILTPRRYRTRRRVCVAESKEDVEAVRAFRRDRGREPLADHGPVADVRWRHRLDPPDARGMSGPPTRERCGVVVARDLALKLQEDEILPATGSS